MLDPEVKEAFRQLDEALERQQKAMRVAMWMWAIAGVLFAISLLLRLAGG